MDDPTKTVTLDGTEYKMSDLSEKAGRCITNLRVVDAELARLKQQLAIHQTARAAYAATLKAELPTH